jgi:hypothetical protein
VYLENPWEDVLSQDFLPCPRHCEKVTCIPCFLKNYPSDAFHRMAIIRNKTWSCSWCLEGNEPLVDHLRVNIR